MIWNERGFVGCRKVFSLEKYWGVQVDRGDKVTWQVQSVKNKLSRSTATACTFESLNVYTW